MNEKKQKLLKQMDESLKKELVELTCDLVDIQSPTGREYEIGEYVYKRFEELGMEMRRQEVEQGRNNIIGLQKGVSQGPSLLLNSHFDTSTTGDEEGVPPGLRAKAFQKDGWIYGLGVSNMKNAFTCYYGAIKMLKKAGIELDGDLIMAGVAGEIEKAPVDQYQGKNFRGGGLGTIHLMHGGVTADYAILGEPTGMRVQPGNTGYIFARITTKGLAQHTWSKENGIDPIAKMVKVMQALQEWEPVFEENHPHPVMKTRVGIGAIQGGYPYKPSVCPPPNCNLYVDIRTVPGQSHNSVKQELTEVLEGLKKKDPEFEYEMNFYLMRNGYQIPFDSPVCEAVSKAHKEITGQDIIYPEPYRYAVSADTGVLFDYGIPGITYGPGGITPDGRYSMYDALGECLKIDNLIKATEVYALSILELCSKK